MTSFSLAAAHVLHAGWDDAGAGAVAAIGALHVEVPSDVRVEAPGLELLVLLAERAWLAAEVDAAVAAGRVRERVLGAHLGPVGAGVDPLAARERRQQRVQRPARPARRRAPVHNLRDAPERDARAPASQAAEAAVVEAVEEAGGPGGGGGGGGAAHGDAGHRLRGGLHLDGLTLMGENGKMSFFLMQSRTSHK